MDYRKMTGVFPDQDPEITIRIYRGVEGFYAEFDMNSETKYMAAVDAESMVDGISEALDDQFGVVREDDEEGWEG